MVKEKKICLCHWEVLSEDPILHFISFLKWRSFMKKHYGTKTTEVTCLFVLQCHMGFVKRNFRNTHITKFPWFHWHSWFSIQYLTWLDTDWSVLCHYYCLSIMERIRNRCQYTVQKTVSCQTQNGTETVVQRLFQSCRWPGPCANLIRYREKKQSHGI